MTKTQFKVATFNLFNYLAPPDAYYEFERIYSSEQWQKKQRWIRDYLVCHSPDVIGFQEVFSIESLRVLVAEQGYLHFAVVDKPTVIDDFIYRDPVVAIASKFPIKDVQAVQVNGTLAKKLGLSEDFKYSRQVLQTTVDIPHLRDCDCYVAHFKSKRSAWSSPPLSDVSCSEQVLTAFTDQLAGGWASSIQRGSEATLLQMHMLHRRLTTGNAMILMGDFNNPINDGILQHLVTSSLRFNNDSSVQRMLVKFSLHDAWELFISNQLDDELLLPRPATHYFGESSSVLDYILMSSEFDAKQSDSFYELSDYINTDRHLINPDFTIDGESTDHAVVSVQLTLRD